VLFIKPIALAITQWYIWQSIENASETLKRFESLTMSNQIKHFYEYGPFRLDPVKRILLKDGAPVSLTPKVFDTLVFFVQNNGRLLEKDELMRTLWPDSFVEETNLAVNISILRKALGESPNEHRYIVTIPGRGYRFVADVREVRDEIVEPVAEDPNSPIISGDEKSEESEVNQQIESEERKETEKEDKEKEDKEKEELKRGPSPTPVPLPSYRYVAFRILALAVLIGVIGIALYRWSSNNIKENTTMAVLPFKPLGANGPDDQYLGMGMTDALITKLSNIRQISILPTSAVRKYDGKQPDPVGMGRELGVDSILEGSIQRADDKVRITVQLINVRDGSSLWADRFEEKFTDIFTVQDLISERVAGALTLKLSDEEERLLKKRYTENSEAFQAYLKGRYHWNNRTVPEIEKAIVSFNQAIEIDRNYALAYAGLADSYALLGISNTLSAKETLDRARAAALKAIELDDRLAEAHTSLGLIKMRYEWDCAGAEKELKKAIELNPNYATAHHWYAWCLVGTRRPREGVEEIKLAQKLDPLSIAVKRDFNSILFYARDYDRVIEQCRKALEMNPNSVIDYINLGQAYAQKGMHQEAIAELQKARAMAGDNPRILTALGYIYAMAGRKDDAVKVLDELKELSSSKPVSSYEVATIYAGMGEMGKAFEWLENACRERDLEGLRINADPRLDPLRSEVKMSDLLRCFGFPS
jgi:TolB-like protein/DNA-binding winged helix-turn-helix (wHTH) protein/Flp pilus assembly protein TadD